MLLLLLTGMTYFYFNWAYFSMVKRFDQGLYQRIWFTLLTFAVNYIFFIACSLLEFHLIVNWSLFAFLLFVETLLYNSGNKRSALFCTLIGIIFGLAVNIFCRSMVAILLNESLQRFDNVTSAENLKGIPVLLGFLLGGLIIHVLCRPTFTKRFQTILEHPQHHGFLFEMMIGLFFYLFLNLLLYSTPLNDILLKVWSIKSSLFSIIGLYIASRYTIRICELDAYREKNRQIEQEMKQSRREEEELRRQMSRDSMTGLYNRQYAEEMIASAMRRNVFFTLCFLDLDGLKNVNDKYGHEEGDRYILTAVEQIRRACRGSDTACRYGGDEFVILFMGMSAEEVEERITAVNENLGEPEIDQNFLYPLSFSFGIVESASFSDWKALIGEADRKMYVQKQRKQAARK